MAATENSLVVVRHFSQQRVVNIQSMWCCGSQRCRPTSSRHWQVHRWFIIIHPLTNAPDDFDDRKTNIWNSRCKVSTGADCEAFHAISNPGTVHDLTFRRSKLLICVSYHLVDWNCGKSSFECSCDNQWIRKVRREYVTKIKARYA